MPPPPPPPSQIGVHAKPDAATSVSTKITVTYNSIAQLSNRTSVANITSKPFTVTINKSLAVFRIHSTEQTTPLANRYPELVSKSL